MEGKKNLCAMISTDLHGKIMAEKEQLELNTLAEYVERIFTELPLRPETVPGW